MFYETCMGFLGHDGGTFDRALHNLAADTGTTGNASALCAVLDRHCNPPPSFGVFQGLIGLYQSFRSAAAAAAGAPLPPRITRVVTELAFHKHHLNAAGGARPASGGRKAIARRRSTAVAGPATYRSATMSGATGHQDYASWWTFDVPLTAADGGKR